MYLFEVQLPSNYLFLGVSNSPVNNIDWGDRRDNYQAVAVCPDEIYHPPYSRATHVLYSSNKNNVDRFYHILIDTINKKMMYYNTITKKLFLIVNYTFTSSYLYLVVFTAKGIGTRTGELNTDVQSFKYPPFLPHDIDLYSKIMETPTWDWKLVANNILSIV